MINYPIPLLLFLQRIFFVFRCPLALRDNRSGRFDDTHSLTRNRAHFCGPAELLRFRLFAHEALSVDERFGYPGCQLIERHNVVKRGIRHDLGHQRGVHRMARPFRDHVAQQGSAD
jgi:hypothetical protein